MKKAIIYFITTLISGCASVNNDTYKVCHVEYVDKNGTSTCLDYSYIYDPVKRAKYPKAEDEYLNQ